MLVKNQEYEMTIEDISNDGEGIGHIRVPGEERAIAVFVKDTVPGDVILVRITKAKKNMAYGRAMKIFTPSKDRVEPRCPVAKVCGGCTLQHYAYEAQLDYKWNKVKNCLERIGGLTGIEEKMEPIYGMKEPYHYRNKAQFPVGRDKDGKVEVGFYAGRSHNIVDSTSCCIQAAINEDIMKVIRGFLDKYKISVYDEEKHAGLIRHVLTRVGEKTNEIMVCIVINGETIPHADELVQALRGFEGMTSICINHNTEKTNKILGDRVSVLWGQGYISDYIEDVKYRISPLSFYQVNPKQTEVLYGKALEYASLTGEEVVWDLYCGIGTISLFLARNAKKVYGVEIVPQAIEDAWINAEINSFDNVEFFVGKAEEVVPSWYEANGDNEGAHPDVIVVDPPRKGCDETLLQMIVTMNPERMVYVSCDPATLARDLKYMTANGYEVKKVSVVDQFGHSSHCESVCLLSKKP